MVSLRLELPPADVNTSKQMAPKQKNLLVPPQQPRVENTTTPPKIKEESSDLPPTGQENATEPSASSAPKVYPRNARGSTHRILGETVLNEEAFPEERVRASLFWGEAGLAPPIHLSETPRRMWAKICIRQHSLE